MTRIWQPSERDRDILSLLARYTALTGKTIAVLLGADRPQVVYNRLSNLIRQGLLEKEVCIRQQNTRNGKTVATKIGTLYFLSERGTKQAKEMGLPYEYRLIGKSCSQYYYDRSRLLENVSLPLLPLTDCGGDGLSDNTSACLVYKDWLIVQYYSRKQAEAWLRRIEDPLSAVSRAGRILMLTGDDRAVRYALKLQLSPEETLTHEYFYAMINQYSVISSLLQDGTEQVALSALRSIYPQVFLQDNDICFRGEIFPSYNLIGLNPVSVRQAQSASNDLAGIVFVSTYDDIKLLTHIAPEIIRTHRLQAVYE